MKHKFLFTIALLPLLLFSQVSDVDWDLDRSRDVITIKYNLKKIDKHNYYDIEVVATEGDIPLPIKSLVGDIGERIKCDSNKLVKWFVRQDVEKLKGTLYINVIATPNHFEADPDPVITPPIVETINKTPYWIGLGGSIAVGGTLMVVGIIKVSDGNQIYDTYKNERNEDAEIYQTYTREDHYNDANSKHKTGVYLSCIGAAVVAGGGYFFVNKIIKANKKEKNNVSFNITPIYNFGNIPNINRKNGFEGAVASFNIRF